MHERTLQALADEPPHVYALANEAYSRMTVCPAVRQQRHTVIH